MMYMTNKELLVKEQYKISRNLDVRSYLHSKFSTNKYGWTNWVFDQFKFEDNVKILELGCGNGGLWLNNMHRIGDKWDITLSDISSGMIEKVREKIHNDNFKFTQIDAENIPFDNNSFDIVIANHMLYHLPQRDKGLSEMRRVLKDEGYLYASTLGMKNMYELEQLVNSFDSEFQYPKTEDVIKFNLENGEDELKEYFLNIDVKKYEDSLYVTEAKPLVDYIMTVSAKVDENKVNGILQYIEKIINEKGSINITKEAGMFIAN